MGQAMGEAVAGLSCSCAGGRRREAAMALHQSMEGGNLNMLRIAIVKAEAQGVDAKDARRHYAQLSKEERQSPEMALEMLQWATASADGATLKSVIEEVEKMQQASADYFDFDLPYSTDWKSSFTVAVRQETQAAGVTNKLHKDFFSITDAQGVKVVGGLEYDREQFPLHVQYGSKDMPELMQACDDEMRLAKMRLVEHRHEAIRRLKLIANRRNARGLAHGIDQARKLGLSDKDIKVFEKRLSDLGDAALLVSQEIRDGASETSAAVSGAAASSSPATTCSSPMGASSATTFGSGSQHRSSNGATPSAFNGTRGSCSAFTEERSHGRRSSRKSNSGESIFAEALPSSSVQAQAPAPMHDASRSSPRLAVAA